MMGQTCLSITEIKNSDDFFEVSAFKTNNNKALDPLIETEMVDTQLTMIICNKSAVASHHEIIVQWVASVNILLNHKPLHPIFQSSVDYVFLYQIGPNTQDTFLVKCKKYKDRDFSVKVSNGKSFISKHNLKIRSNGQQLNLYYFITGALFVLALISFIYFLYLKELFFLYYALYLLVINLFNMGRINFTIDVFYDYPQYYEIYETLLKSIQAFYYVFYFSFVRSFINSQEKYKKIDLICKLAIRGSLLSFACLLASYYLFDFEVFEIFFTIYRILVAIIAIVVIVIAIKYRTILLNFLIIGSTFLLLGALLSMLFSAFHDLNPLPIWPVHYMNLGILIEVIFFTFGIGYKVFLIANDRVSYLEKLKTIHEEKEIELKDKISEVSEELKKQQAGQLITAIELKEKEMEMDILRSQINPHFMFNTINALKSLTGKGDTNKAKLYFDKFSSLLRFILENSRSKKISLSAEINTIQLYLDLENLRLKHPVVYHINVEPGLDINFIKIPPTIIQPFVENSIWHGLTHKDSPDGKISLDILCIADDELRIIIADNGIGRDAAAKFKATSLNHKSIGVSIINERLKLINNDELPNIIYEDLKDEQGSALGTKVTLRVCLY